MNNRLTLLLSSSQARLFLSKGAESSLQDQGILAYLKTHPNVPLLLLLDSPEYKWYRLSLTGLRIWDRFSLSRQTELSEFEDYTAAGTYTSNKNQSLFVGMKLSDFQHQWIENLAQQCCPLAQTTSWISETVRFVLSTTPPSTRWHVIQTTTAEAEKILIFCDHEAILLIRPFREDLETLLQESLSYLRRQGYQNESLSFIHDGGLTSSPAPFIRVIQNPGLKNLIPTLVSFTQTQQSKTQLTLKVLQNQRRLYTHPKIAALLAGIVCLSVGGIVLSQLWTIHGYRQQLKSSKQELQKLDQAFPTLESQSHKLKGFQTFLSLSENRRDPIFFLKQLALVLTEKGVVTELSWQSEKQPTLLAKVVLSPEQPDFKSLKTHLNERFPDFRITGKADSQNKAIVVFTWKLKRVK